MRALLLCTLVVVVAACRKAEPPPAPPQVGGANPIVASAPVPGSGGDKIILPLGYPTEADDAPEWTKRLVKEETIDGEKRLVAIGWAKGIQSDSLAQTVATAQARTRLVRIAQGQPPDSTQPVEGEISDTRVEDTFRSKSGALFVKISGPAPK